MKSWKTEDQGKKFSIIGKMITLYPVFRNEGPDEELVWDASGDRITATTSKGLQLVCNMEEIGQGRLRLSMEIKNNGSASAQIHDVAVYSLRIPAALNRVLLNGREMNSRSDLCVVGSEQLPSSCVTGYTDPGGTKAIVIGWENPSENFTWIRTESVNGGDILASASCDREGIPLKTGESLKLPPLLVFEGTDLWELMRLYAKASANVCGAMPSDDIMSGWCSWYTYYGTESVADILSNTRILNEKGFGESIKTIQIDDGWNLEKSGSPRVWGDWEAGGKFPQGMKWTVDEISKEGFLAGLWLAPFSVDPASNFFKNHPDLLVMDDNGKPKDFWGVYALDLTNPKALEFVRTTFDRVFNEWGFEYIKIDFLLHAIQPGRRYDPDVTTAMALRNGLKVIREVAGDRFILGCGCPMGPALGIVDAMRIGPDVSHRWYIPMNLKEWPVGNCSVYSGAVHTVWRHWMHGAWWQNDPDCILVHDQATPGEIHEFNKIDNGAFAKEPPFGLTEEEAAFWVRLIWMSGSMGMLGENPELMKESRLQLLQRSFPIHGKVVRWLGNYEDPRVAVMALEENEKTGMVGLFNFTDAPQTASVTAIKGFEGKVSCVEWLSGEEVSIETSSPRFPELPPRSGRIWQLK